MRDLEKSMLMQHQVLYDRDDFLAILKGFVKWVADGNCIIKPREGGLIPLQFNSFQKEIMEELIRMAARGQPIRMIILKSRKMGVSTLVQALFYFLTSYVPQWFAVSVAHTIEATVEIFGITKRIHRNIGELAPEEDVANRRQIAYKHDSTFTTLTAGGQYPGSGSTIDSLHLSEVPKWKGTKSFIMDQMASLLNAVPDSPGSIVIFEATANMADRTGEFERRYKAAVAGKNNYKPIFGAWYKEPTYRLENHGLKEQDLDETEIRYRDELGLTLDQIAWRRRKKFDECQGSEIYLKQEYPTVPEEAFQTSTGRVFPILSKEKHAAEIDVSNGWELFRGIDWGGSHPFCCIWVAHKNGAPRFTVDIKAAHETWSQLTTYSRDQRGRPSMLGDDAIDCIRYVIQAWDLTGHVHVYRELFIENSAQLGLSELDLAKQIIKMSEGEKYEMSIADRSRPNSINLFNQIGVECIPSRARTVNRLGEVEDGLAMMFNLMNGADPIPGMADSETEVERIMRRAATRGGAADVPLEILFQMDVASLGGEYHPYLGECY